MTLVNEQGYLFKRLYYLWCIAQYPYMRKYERQKLHQAT